MSLFYELITVEVIGDPPVRELLEAMRLMALEGNPPVGYSKGKKVSTAYKNVWLAVTADTNTDEMEKNLKDQFPRLFQDGK